MLTPEQIQQLDAGMGLQTNLQLNSAAPSRADEIMQIAQKSQQGQQMQLDESGGFVNKLIDTTIGKHGVVGTVANVVNPFIAKSTLEGSNEVGVQAQGMNKQADQFIAQAQKETDPSKKAYYIQQAHQFLSSGAQLGQQQGKIREKAAKDTGQDISTGKNIENILGTSANAAATLAPFGIAKPATLLGKVVEGVAIGGTSGAGQAMTEGQDVKGILTSAGAGAAVGGLLPALTTALGGIAKRVTGVMTGAGKNVIQQAIDNPKAVSEAISNSAKTPELKQNLVEQARTAIRNFLDKRGAEYGQGLETLTSKTPGFQGKQSAIDSFVENIKKFGGSVDENGGLNFSDTALTKGDQTNLMQAWDTLKNWKDTSIKGSDNLRQAIGNLMDDFKLTGNTRANNILANVKNDLVSAVEKNAPGYKNLVTEYGEKTQLAKNLMKELVGSANSKPSTQLNNVLKLFQKDPTVMKDLINVMGEEDAQRFISEISGAILSTWIPGGRLGNIARITGELGGIGYGVLTGNPGLAAGAGAAVAASSPRLVGTAATTIGKATQAGITTGARRAATVGAGKLGAEIIGNKGK